MPFFIFGKLFRFYLDHLTKSFFHTFTLSLLLPVYSSYIPFFMKIIIKKAGKNINSIFSSV